MLKHPRWFTDFAFRIFSIISILYMFSVIFALSADYFLTNLNIFLTILNFKNYFANLYNILFAFAQRSIERAFRFFSGSFRLMLF